MDLKDFNVQVRKIRLRLLKNAPYFGMALLKLARVRVSPIKGTAWTDGRNIVFSEDFIKKITPEQCNFVLLHELYHILLLHVFRLKGRDPFFWNLAADLKVNRILEIDSDYYEEIGIPLDLKKEFGIFELPDIYNVEDFSVEEIYSLLENNPNISKFLRDDKDAYYQDIKKFKGTLKEWQIKEGLRGLESYTEMPAPLANRFEIHNISYDLDQWKRDFAYPNKINEAVIAYLNFKPVAFHNFDTEGESLRFASPRSWEAVSDIMNTGKLDIGSKLLRAKIEANIGETEAASFLAFLKEREAVDVVDQIMDGTYKEVPERDDIKYILISSLVYKLTEAGLPKDKFVNVINYMLLMDAEFTALAIEDLKAANSPTEINRLLLMEVDSPELELFISNNKALLE